MARITESEQGLTPEEMDDFLATVPYPVPDSYREFMMNTNGGMPEPDFYQTDPEAEGYRVHQFYSIKYGDLLVENLLKIYSDEQRPANLLPFAKDEGGNHFCIDLENSSVCVFYTDGSSDQPSPPIAPNFQAFIDGLADEEDFEYDF